MKLLRYGAPGQERPGLLDAEGRVRDLSSVVDDIAGDVLSRSGRSKLDSLDVAALPLVPSADGPPRMGPCVAGVGKFLCIGLNYSDHAKESGMELPPEPVVFSKATSAINGPSDDVHYPRKGSKMDWEVELGVVIGEKAHYVDEEHASDCIAGYCVINDLSERAFQLEQHGQWVKGKSCDTFGPIGPWLVTPDEVGDPHELDIWLEVDGHRYQNGNTRTMVYQVPFLVSYLSQFMSLQAGDVISTGTPPGVGLGLDPPTYLEIGQEMHLGIQGLGEQRQRVIEAP